MKKQMKMMISIMLIIVMSIIVIPSVYAADETNFSVLLTASNAKVEKGKTVDVIVKLGKFKDIGKGVNTFMADFEYDKTKLSIESSQIVAQNSWDIPTYENDKLLTQKGSMITAEEAIMKMTFTVKSEAELGKTVITIKNPEAANDENDFVGKDGTIEIEIVDKIIPPPTDDGNDEGQTCEHTYATKTNDTQHWQECTKCKTVKEGTKENHKFGTYTDNNNGKHSVTCTVCSYKLTKDHNYENGKCKDCNAEEPKTEGQTCEHTYTTKTNDTQHWQECTKCKTVKEGTKENHKFGTYTDNNNGKHSVTCTVCSYKLTEEHNFKDAKCTKCNANEKKPENGDGTIADKEYDKAGTGTIISLATVIVAVVTIIMYRKNKKYQDII